MTAEQILKYGSSALGGIVIIGGFLYWHFKTVNGFKDDIHKLELKQKDLEHRDELQQQTIDQLEKLYPTLNKVIEKLFEEKK